MIQAETSVFTNITPSCTERRGTVQIFDSSKAPFKYYTHIVSSIIVSNRTVPKLGILLKLSSHHVPLEPKMLDIYRKLLERSVTKREASLVVASMETTVWMMRITS